MRGVSVAGLVPFAGKIETTNDAKIHEGKQGITRLYSTEMAVKEYSFVELRVPCGYSELQPPRPPRSIQVFEDPRGAHAAAHAHRDQAITRIPAFQFANNAGRQFRARTAQRMS